MTNTISLDRYRNTLSDSGNYFDLGSPPVILSCMGVAVIITNAQGIVCFLNAEAVKLTGQDWPELKNKKLIKYVTVLDETTHQPVDPITHCLINNKTVQLNNNYVLLRLDGKEIPIQGSIAPLYSDNKEIQGTVVALLDDSHQRTESRRFAHCASRDAVPQLDTRETLKQRFQRLRNIKPRVSEHVLLYLALHPIDEAHETCGPSARFVCLKQINNLLLSQIRRRDALVQFGDQDFGILLEYCSCKQAVHIAFEICDLIEFTGLSWYTQKLSLQASVGIAAINEGIKDMESLIEIAKYACSLAQKKKRKRVEIYQDRKLSEVINFAS